VSLDVLEMLKKLLSRWDLLLTGDGEIVVEIWDDQRGVDAPFLVVRDGKVFGSFPLPNYPDVELRSVEECIRWLEGTYK